MARYSVIKSDPPPATRLRAPKRPPAPANWVWVVSWMELVIQESSPASETTDSLGSRLTESTGIVVPRMRDCMKSSWRRVGRQSQRSIESTTDDELFTRPPVFRDRAGSMVSLTVKLFDKV